MLEKTTEGFRSRWNNYKCNDRKYTRNEKCFQEHLFKHFHCRKHTGFLENVKITLINKTDGQNPKKREDYWRKTLKTYAPFGFNVEDSVWALLLLLSLLLLLNIVTFVIVNLIAVAIIAFNYLLLVTRCAISMGKPSCQWWKRQWRLIMMAAVLHGYFQWFFRLCDFLFLGVSRGTLVWVGCFYKVEGHCVSSSI